MRPIELLAPARDLECGLEAVRHGADAVYIGAPRFGARAAAGNSVENIAELVRYAHTFGVRIYVTVNTLLYDDEIEEVDRLIDALQAAQVDALITQDTRLPAINRGRLPLHSSTQMDNRTIADVRERLEAGYEQTVLARELSLEDIRAIHEAVPAMPLEVFVHGALCVCYSGRCYASEYCFGRSANRGECAQFCRLPFDLIDGEGKVVTVPSAFPEGIRQRHLLSLRDMNRAADLEPLMDAGVTSFKIEGRLKDVSYVKNTTAYYRQRIDEIIARRPDDYCRSSYGISTFTFTPNVNKSFNRRFTDYFLHGRTPDMACFATPKAIGEPIGTVKSLSRSTSGRFDTSKNSPHRVKNPSSSGYQSPNYFEVLPPTGGAEKGAFSNGDGLCFFDADNRLQGFRVNRVDDQGRLYPADPSILTSLRKGTPLYRNYDAAFERLLARPSADRRIPVTWLLEDTPDGFRLTLTVPKALSPFTHRCTATLSFPYTHELARTPQADNIRRQLLRLGDTPYTTTDADITIAFSDNWFIPSSVLSDWRRQLCGSLIDASLIPHSSSLIPHPSSLTPHPSSFTPHPSSTPQVLMTCRYCLRYALGFCPHPLTPPPSSLTPMQPWSLRLADGRTFPLRFDCQRCEMQVLSCKS